MDRKDPLKTPAPPTEKLSVRKARTLQRRSSASGSENSPNVQTGGLRPFTLLKDRDTNKEGDASIFAGTPPLVLGKKKQKVKVTRDENAGSGSGNNHLKPLQLGRSDSIKLRGMLRRTKHCLPWLLDHPPRTQMGSAYEHWWTF